MKVNISFHNVDHSESLEHFIQEKSEVLNRFLKNPEHLNWVVDSSNGKFEPHLDLALNGQNQMVKSSDENVFRAVSNVISKAKRLLNDRHGRMSKHQ
jgi:ribosomal subunit interface protein